MTFGVPLIQYLSIRVASSRSFAWSCRYQLAPVFAAVLDAICFSESFAASDDTVRSPGFARFDAARFATTSENSRVQLSGKNIFNRGYWASAAGNTNMSPGQGRSLRLKAIHGF
jgi:catecholate siderophore receptor